jgi:pyrophosphatase PpaX
MKKKLSAIVFDVDGTILDTREFILKTFEHTLTSHGYSVPTRGAIQAVVAGKILEDGYLQLAPDGDIIALCDTHRVFQKKRYDLIVAYEGLTDTLSSLRDKGIVSGLYSSRGKATLRPSLEHMQVLKYFDAVIDGGDVQNHKPHPEGVLKALEILGVSPQDSAMIGDSHADIEAGKAAHCALTIGITHGLGSRTSLEEAGADHIVDSLKDILPILI